MGYDADLLVVAEQEQMLVWERFGAAEAWAVGCALREEALKIGKPITIEVEVCGRRMFGWMSDGAPVGQADWIRRKRNTVMRFGRSSYAMGLELEVAGKTIEEKHGLTLVDYAMHGGGVPIVLIGTGCIGCVVLSGLHQRVDHALVVAAMGKVLGVTVETLTA